MWSDFVSKVLEGVLLAFAPVLAAMITAWLLAKVRSAWAEFKQNQAVPAFVLEEVISIVVNAAEQMKLQGFIEDKKEYALQTAEAWLKARGFVIDLEFIEAAIESAVRKEMSE